MTENLSAGRYIELIRRNYSLYILTNRAIPSICDGLKCAARRILWTARNGEKIKSATLAGATMPIHPHAPPESAINTMAAPYGNNIPLLQGYGAFGTLIAPDAYSASRYTSVMLSQFTKDAIMVDMDLIPMQENYDSSLKEPMHFLPIIPVVLLNSTEGIAIGYSCNILPRRLTDIIQSQINVLDKKDISSKVLIPYFKPLNQQGELAEGTTDKWSFKGSFVRKDSTTITITSLPYGLTHNKMVTNEDSRLNKLLDEEKILDYDDKSKNVIEIDVKFKRGVLSELSDDQIYKMFGLVCNSTENMTILNYDHSSVLQTDVKTIITTFTEWRLTWYVDRYKLLKRKLKVDIQKYQDIMMAISNQAGHVASSKKDKEDFKTWLKSIGIVNDEYIASLPTYRYTKREYDINKEKLDNALLLLEEYNNIISNEQLRRDIYKRELNNLLKQYGEKV